MCNNRSVVVEFLDSKGVSAAVQHDELYLLLCAKRCEMQERSDGLLEGLCCVAEGLRDPTAGSSVGRRVFVHR
jgi:hypothetical protein